MILTQNKFKFEYDLVQRFLNFLTGGILLLNQFNTIVLFPEYYEEHE